MLLENEQWRIVNLDALTYAGNLETLAHVDDERYVFVKGDIRDRETVARVFTTYDVTRVVHFAAESHVDRSIMEPDVFLTTNVLGTQVLLDVAKRYWKLAPDDPHSRTYRDGVKFVHISTDEVYGTLGSEGLFTETTPLAPNSPYSASKASSDFIVRAYHETYGLPINITRCSNNYGPYQFPEKLIPLMILRARNGDVLPVYGDGQQVRDWLHVNDHCRAIWLVAERGQNGEVYNIGGNNEQTNLSIVCSILQMLGRDESQITFVADRPGHDRRYAIDHTKITSELGWHPLYTFETGLRETVDWYISNTTWVDRVVSGAYRNDYETSDVKG